MAERHRLSVLIVSYECRDVLLDGLACLRDAVSDEDEVVIVDNGSKDGTPQMVRERFPDFRLISNPSNVGFAAGANLAVRLATGHHSLILNPDTRVSANALQALIECLDELDRDALIGPTLLNSDGSIQRSGFRFPTPMVLASEQLSLNKVISRLAPRPGQPRQRTVPVDWLKGACLLAPTKLLLSHGPFDERFFMFSEDTDLCYRLQADGVPVLLVPDVSIVHLGGMSTRRHPTQMTALFVESLYRFYQKHYSRRQLALAVLIIRSVAGLKAFRGGVAWLSRRLAGDARARIERREIRTLLEIIAVRPPVRSRPGDE